MGAGDQEVWTAVTSTVWTRPEPVSTPMCALKPKCQALPFLPWCASGFRAPSRFLVDTGASTKVASTIVPRETATPRSASAGAWR